MSLHVSPARRPLFAEWLIQPMRRNASVYLKVGIAAVLINLLGLLSSLFTMTVYDRVVPNHATASLIGLTVGLTIVICGDFALRTLRAYFIDIAGADIDADVGGTVFDRLLALRLDLKKGSTGALAGLMRELETLRDFFASATMTALVDVPFIIVTLTLIALLGGPVVIVPLVMVPIVILTGWLTHPAMDRLSARSMTGGLLKQSVLVETIGALETIKATGAGDLMRRRWAFAMHDHSQSSLTQRLVATISVNVATSANTISYAGVVVVGVILMAEEKLTMGALIACSILSGRAVAPLGQIAQLMSRLNATRAAYRQIDAMMTLPPEGPSEEALKVRTLSGHVELRGVTFRYPGSPEPTIAGMDLMIGAGEKVAILGRVGSGKSTLLRLLLGLYPPQEGMILFDGTESRQFDPETMRRSIGAALQESVLLTGTVRENIDLGRAAVDDEELLRVARLSGTHQFIGQLANGYDLKLADRGEGLSGGQRQSIAIARALAGSPPILLFDEPSSAMDSDTETALLQRLRAEIVERTVVLVTHRPPLLQLVDRIVLLDGGRIVADGPRDAILRQMTPVKAA